ncbi:hypothetical protein JD844_021554 [Phrynosoma platyrhinos]|uniref:unspecific monooxygenase n=1 Tax=Phrynosoma platyrhinos TaxID=52577 RepID=A0ABQ7SUM2_PHRPL|nr:hypothetical protein JD844_021554 [Phrynosoma platyrhinos]
MEEFRGIQEKPFDPTFLLSCALSNVICAIVFGNRYEYKDKKFLTMLNVMNDSFAIMSSPWGQVAGYMNGVDDGAFVRSVDVFCSAVSSTSSIAEKVHEEIDRVIGQTRRPCMADRGQMPYTDAVIHEIQRFISLVPLGVPRAVIKDTPFRQYVIPKQGTTIYPILTSILHDSKEFPNPKEFDPQHFLHEDGTFRNSDFFLPFSAAIQENLFYFLLCVSLTGRRICIGESLACMELFLFFTTILQNVKLKSLIHAKDIDLTPFLSSVGNIPQPYQLCIVPR